MPLSLACFSIQKFECMYNRLILGLPRWYIGKESACQCRRCKKCRFDPFVVNIRMRKKWQPTVVFFPGKIPRTEESGRLWSMGLQRIGHDWATDEHWAQVYNKCKINVFSLVSPMMFLVIKCQPLLSTEGRKYFKK